MPCDVWLSRLCLIYGEPRLKATIDRSVNLALEAVGSSISH